MDEPRKPPAPQRVHFTFTSQAAFREFIDRLRAEVDKMEADPDYWTKRAKRRGTLD